MASHIFCNFRKKKISKSRFWWFIKKIRFSKPEVLPKIKNIRKNRTLFGSARSAGIRLLKKMHCQGVERIAVRYSFKRGEIMRYEIMAD
jgi:hypothetical protein